MNNREMSEVLLSDCFPDQFVGRIVYTSRGLKIKSCRKVKER